MRIFDLLERVYTFWRDVLRQFIRDSCLTRAAALSYATLFYLVPLMTVSFAVLKAFPEFQGIAQEIQTFIFNNFVAESAQVVQTHVQDFMNQVNRLSAPGLLALLVVAVLMIFNMEGAFNVIWRVHKRRQGVSAFLMYWAVLTLLPIIAAVGLTVSAYVSVLSGSLNLPLFQSLKTLALAYVPTLLIWVAFSLLYLTVPNCRVPWRSALAGGVVAALLFALAKYGFTLYIEFFPTYKLIYGALAALPIFLVWVYVSWIIVLFGAVVSHVAAGRRGKERVQDSYC